MENIPIHLAHDFLQRQTAIVVAIHAVDLPAGKGCVFVPNNQNQPSLMSRQEDAWQYLFPANAITINPENNIISPLNQIIPTHRANK